MPRPDRLEVLLEDAAALVEVVAFAASASFMTHVGYRTNAMVLGPGNCRFSGYMKFGAPLNLIFWIVSSIMIPVIWPL